MPPADLAGQEGVEQPRTPLLRALSNTGPNINNKGQLSDQQGCKQRESCMGNFQKGRASGQENAFELGGTPSVFQQEDAQMEDISFLKQGQAVFERPGGPPPSKKAKTGGDNPENHVKDKSSSCGGGEDVAMLGGDDEEGWICVKRNSHRDRTQAATQAPAARSSEPDKTSSKHSESADTLSAPATSSSCATSSTTQAYLPVSPYKASSSPAAKLTPPESKATKRKSRELAALMFDCPGPRTSFLNDLIDKAATVEPSDLLELTPKAATVRVSSSRSEGSCGSSGAASSRNLHAGAREPCHAKRVRSSPSTPISSSPASNGGQAESSLLDKKEARLGAENTPSLLDRKEARLSAEMTPKRNGSHSDGSSSGSKEEATSANPRSSKNDAVEGKQPCAATCAARLVPCTGSKESDLVRSYERVRVSAGAHRELSADESATLRQLEMHATDMLGAYAKRLVRVGRYASQGLITRQARMLLECSRLKHGIEVHASVSALAHAAYKASALSVDCAAALELVTQVCDTLCSDTDTAVAASQTLLLSLVSDLAHWSKHPVERGGDTSADGRDDTGGSCACSEGFNLLEGMVKTQANPVRSAGMLLEKLVKALHASAPSSSRVIAALVGHLCDGMWSSQGFHDVVVACYNKIPLLRTKDQVIRAIGADERAVQLLDAALLEFVGAKCKDANLRKQPPSWRKFSHVYLHVLDASDAADQQRSNETLTERCMLLTAMALSLSAADGRTGQLHQADTAEAREGAAAVLVDALARMCAPGFASVCAATFRATKAAIECLMPSLSPEHNIKVVKIAGAHMKALEHMGKAQVKSNANVRKAGRKGRGAEAAVGPKAAQVGSTRVAEAAASVPQEVGSSAELPRGEQLVGFEAVQDLEVKSAADGAWWNPVYISRYNASADTYTVRWDGSIFGGAPGPGDIKDPAMVEEGVTRARVRIMSSGLKACDAEAGAVVLCRTKGVYRDGKIVRAMGKNKFEVLVEGFKTREGVWEPRAYREILPLSKLFQIF